MEKKRGKILRYNQKDLVNTVNPGKSIGQAAARFNVPRSTIGDRMSCRFNTDEPLFHGRQPAIPAEIENEIVAAVKMAAKLGVGLCRRHIIASIFFAEGI